MTEPDKIYITYEPWHIEGACAEASRGASIACLNYWVEYELKKKNIPYISLRDIVDAETGAEEWWLLAQEVAREWYRLPAMGFFEHRSIRIGEFLEPTVELYLSRLFYYTRICTALKKKYPGTHFLIPTRGVDEVLTIDCLASYERRAVIDAARMVGLPSTEQPRELAQHVRSTHSNWKGLVIRAYNFLIRCLPRHPLKIYASENWSNIREFIPQMKGVELVLMDGAELKHIPWRQLLAHRIRFRHPNDSMSAVQRRAATVTARRYEEQWSTAKQEVAVYLTGLREGVDWSPVLQALEHLMEYANVVVMTIDALCLIVEEEQPNLILQTASVGLRQQYFFVLARIAAQSKIPTVELQHAAASIDPRSVFSRIETDYLASYGPYTNSSYERIGYAQERLVPMGLPRFDRLLRERACALEKGKRLIEKFGLDTSRPVLLAAVPFSDSRLSIVTFDSYELRDFFMMLRSLQDALPDLQIVFKFKGARRIYAMREYIDALFPTGVAIAGDEDPFALLCASGAALCGCSTVIYETLLAGKPLVLFPWRQFDIYSEKVYAPVAPLARSNEEVVGVLKRIFADSAYREELRSREVDFLTGYYFDGKSSKRIATFLRKLLFSKVYAPGDVLGKNDSGV